MSETKSPAHNLMTTPDTLAALGDLPSGARGIVRCLRGGQEFTSRVSALGLTIGAEAVIVRNYGRGPIIVLARDTRVALGRGEAAKVLVEVVSAR
jgi:ferrous iron transport protein A